MYAPTRGSRGRLRSALRQLPEAWREARFLSSLPRPRERRARGGHSRRPQSGPTRRHRPLLDLAPQRRSLAGRRRERTAGASTRRGSTASSSWPAWTSRRRRRRRLQLGRSLAAQWDEHVRALPPDWSDVFAEISFRSSDDLELAALLLSPLNPSRFGERPGFRFRVARRFGYGAAPEIVRRCLERVDEEGLRAEVRILHALSDTSRSSHAGPGLVRGRKARRWATRSAGSSSSRAGRWSTPRESASAR